MIVVVTGTDTGVGKTLVTTGIAHAARARGWNVRALKPVESGWSENEPGDGERLAAAAGQDEPARAIDRFEAPLAPPLAAEKEGKTIDLQKHVEIAAALDEGVDLTIVEGAGGLLSPLTWDHDLRDLAAQLDAPLLIVAANRIGVVHQVRSLLDILENADLDVLGVVLSETAEADEAAVENHALLERVEPGIPIVALPRVSDDHAAATALSEVLDWIAASKGAEDLG